MWPLTFHEPKDFLPADENEQTEEENRFLEIRGSLFYTTIVGHVVTWLEHMSDTCHSVSCVRHLGYRHCTPRGMSCYLDIYVCM